MLLQNTLLIAMELNVMLPVNELSEFTRDYEGFYHLNQFDCSVERAKMTYIIRDHDRDKFEQKKAFLQHCVDLLGKKYSGTGIQLDIKDQYYNMREKIEPFFHIVTLAEQAMRENGIEPVIRPVRGGTDGAHLSFMGLPCPNIFSGGHNFHSRYEFISLESMEKASQVIISIIQLVEAQTKSA